MTSSKPRDAALVDRVHRLVLGQSDLEGPKASQLSTTFEGHGMASDYSAEALHFMRKGALLAWPLSTSSPPRTLR